MRNTLENKILTTVMIPLAIGILFFYLLDLKIERDHLVEEEREKVTLISDTIMNGIENIMLAGRGDFARRLVEQLAYQGSQTGNLRKLEVYNSEASLALNGNKSRVPSPDLRVRIQEVLKTGRVVEYSFDDEGVTINAMLRPLANKTECQGCHDSKDATIGVVLIGTSAEDLNTALESNNMLIIAMATSTLLIVTLVLRFLIRRNIVSPIRDLTIAITNIAEGRSAEPLKTGFKDEIGLLVRNFNQMTRNLLDSQERLKESHEELAESNRLLLTLNQEMHHRIRNNLQTMADLLSLELTHHEARFGVQSIRDSVGRVKSIAAVHELLRPSSVEETNIKEIADRVVAISAHGIQGRGKTISTAVLGPAIMLSSKQSIAVALVLNELVSNAFEHGFPKQTDSGEIRVAMGLEDNIVTISLTNNGIGLPTNFFLPTSQGLGLQIARTLVENDLKGTLTLEPQGDTTVAKVRFSLSQPTLT